MPYLPIVAVLKNIKNRRYCKEIFSVGALLKMWVIFFEEYFSLMSVMIEILAI
jgi:hypothetical protein